MREDENPHEDYSVSIQGEELSREYVLQLSFEEAALGTTRHISIKAGLVNILPLLIVSDLRLAPAFFLVL